MLPYPDTQYAATRADDAQWQGLDGDCEAETCVIGGGLAGLATALGLAERGRSVVLLEANRLGWGASGRNGGFVSAGYPLSMRDLVARLGLSDASALWGLSVEALALVSRRAEALGPNTLQGQGALRCRMAWHPDTLGEHVGWMNDNFTAGLVHLPPRELRDLLATEAYADGYLNPVSLQIHPLNLARGMAHAAVAAGAQLHEGAEVVAIEMAGASHTVVTRSGSVVARHVVLAGGAHLGMLHTGLWLATVPVASFVVTTNPAPEQLCDVIRTRFAVSDTRVATDYYRVLPDGRLLWGGRANAFDYAPDTLRSLLKCDIARIYPQLADLTIESAWSGLMPIARHRMPVIGPLTEGLWAAACFGGLGLVNTTLAGELIASAIAEGDDRHRRFAPFGLPFAGGTFGRAAFQLIYWRHQFEDWLKRPRAGRAGDKP